MAANLYGMRRRTLAAAAVLGGVLAAAVLFGEAAAQCVSAQPTSLAPAVVCTAEEPASGTVAVSVAGPAQGSGQLPAASASGSGNAERSVVAASGTGTAGQRVEPDQSPCRTPEEDRTLVSAGARGDSFSCFASVSGTGKARSSGVGLSGTGESGGSTLSVSGTGKARGHANKDAQPQYVGALVAVSGCEADNTGPDHQLATADPSRVWIHTAQNPLTGQPGPTNITTGLKGVCS